VNRPVDNVRAIERATTGGGDRVRQVHVTCPHDCPDACSLLVSVDSDTQKALKVEGNPAHPVTRGFLCNKVNNYLDYVNSPRRMLYPHRRAGPKGPGAKFERISWDTALTEIAQRLHGVIGEYGPEAVQPFSYSGTLGVLGFSGMGDRFFNRMGAARLARTICTAAGAAAKYATLGPVADADIERIPEMDVVILWATNVASTGVHLVPFINEAKARGATIIAIDPRATRTTQLADWHLQPRPGTDAALALGMLQQIVAHGLHDAEFLAEHTVGWERFAKERLPEYTLDKVAAITGLAEADIEKLALLYGRTRKSFIRLNWGIQRHDNGGMTTRAILVLGVATNAQSEGGGICLSTGPEMRGVDLNYLQGQHLLKGRTPRTVNMIQIGDALNGNPSGSLQGGALSPPIKALFCWNSDAANCVPDSIGTRRGLMREDLYTVVHDTFFTDTCDYADLILPADTALEHLDLHGAYGNYFFSLSQTAIPKQGESLDNQEMFRRLARAMGYDDACFSETDEQMIRRLIDAKVNPLFEGITYEALLETGYARGKVDSPRRPGFNSTRWPTPSGKIEIFSETLQRQGHDPMPAYVPEREGWYSGARDKYPLQIISAATHYFIGASFQGVERLRDMQARPTFEMNATDAAARGIVDGDFCRLFNDRGATFGYARIVDGMLAGVLGAPKQLYGSTTPGGVNVNALTSQQVSDMGGSPVYYSTLAQVEKCSKEAA
jgi:anaerobic selenocysteine-containing dehydrogenase